MRPSAAGFLLALLPALAGCSPGDAVDAASFLADLRSTAADAGASRREAIAFVIEERGHRADLYRPEREAEAAIVLVPGLAPAGRDDPRLVSLASALARARFLVLVPDLPGFRAQRVTAADGRAIADAARHLRDRPDHRGKLGIAAISYAVGPALLAALEPDVNAAVGFVVAVGGYYDTTAIVTFFTTGFHREPDGEDWRFMTPNAYGKWVFVLANAERIDNARDRVALIAMARRKLVDLDADIADLEAGLGAEGEAVMALLANRRPERVPALLAALPAAIRADLEGLDLSRQDLRRLRARVILIHGRDDAIVPWTESARLAAALPANQVDLHLLDGLAHADFNPGDIGDGLSLWQAIYRLMGERGSR